MWCQRRFTVLLRLCRGLSSYSPKLSDLARDVLGRQLRPDESQPHDCATDAAAAVALAQHAMVHGCREPLQPPSLKVTSPHPPATLNPKVKLKQRQTPWSAASTTWHCNMRRAECSRPACGHGCFCNASWTGLVQSEDGPGRV